VIAVGYLALAILVNLYILSNILSRLHWYLGPATGALPNVLVPALVLLLSGAGAWVVQRRQRAPVPEN
jgi:LPXTG-motif cell wall-anchored protein